MREPLKSRCVEFKHAVIKTYLREGLIAALHLTSERLELVVHTLMFLQRRELCEALVALVAIRRKAVNEIDRVGASLPSKSRRLDAYFSKILFDSSIIAEL